VPQDFVIATGETRTVREFVNAAFARAGVTLEWKGSGVDETATIAVLDPTGEAAREGALAPGQVVVSVDPRYFRPTEVELLLGDPSRAKEALGWKPRVSFAELVEMMVDADLQQQKRERYLKDGGYAVHTTFE
ncbi:MAG: GDP-mannose 4,6-dehydratase, partial [Spirochaetaceae bacterium]